MGIKLTDNMKGLISHAIKAKGLSKKRIAESVGLSQPWATYLTRPVDSGGLRSLTDDQTKVLSKLLDLEFVELLESNRPTESAMRLSRLAREDPLLNNLMVSLDLYACECDHFKPNELTDEDLSDLGSKFIKIVERRKKSPQQTAQEILDLISRN